MTAVPGLRELMRAGVRRSVAAEYRRLVAAGVNRRAAVVLARGIHRPIHNRWTTAGGAR